MAPKLPPSAEHPRWEAFKSNFTQSNYITDFWNWFMTLMSKAAEMVLFGTVLYSGYQLLPGVPHVPAPRDAAVFVIQQGALDIGGMGLLKLAKRANLSKDSFPVRLGVALVVLMILNVALASIKHTLPMIPDGVFVGIETLLLIARAVVAVLLGHAIHALREEYGESTITVKEADELQQAIEALTAELARVQENVHRRLSSELASVRESVQVHLTSELALVHGNMQQGEARLEALVRQLASLTEAVHEAREARQHEAVHEAREAPKPASQKTEARTKVLPLRQREAVPTEKRAAVYALLDMDNTLSSYEIAEKTGYAPSTIQRYMKDWKMRHTEAVHEVAQQIEATHTAS